MRPRPTVLFFTSRTPSVMKPLSHGEREGHQQECCHGEKGGDRVAVRRRCRRVGPLLKADDTTETRPIST